jgi:hypothetical protein
MDEEHRLIEIDQFKHPQAKQLWEKFKLLTQQWDNHPQGTKFQVFNRTQALEEILSPQNIRDLGVTPQAAREFFTRVLEEKLLVTHADSSWALMNWQEAKTGMFNNLPPDEKAIWKEAVLALNEFKRKKDGKN